MAKDKWDKVDEEGSSADGIHFGSRTYGSKLLGKSPKTGTEAEGFVPRGRRPAGDAKGEAPKR